MHVILLSYKQEVISSMYDKSYHFAEENQLSSPQLIYYEDGIRRNTEAAIRAAGGAGRLWPHVKSHKMQAMIRMQLEYGIRRFKCATLREAQMAAAAGADEVLLAYMPVGPNQEAYLRLCKLYPAVRFHTIGDDLDTLAHLGSLSDKPVSVLLDVDTGLHRTGVPISSLESFYREASKLPGIRMHGFHVYDGEDHQSLLQDRMDAVTRLEQAFFPVYDLIRSRFGPQIVIFGGTPSMPCFATCLSHYQDAFLSPGTLFLGDYGYSTAFPDMKYPPAAAVLTRVISHPGEGRFTLDCGTKALSCDQSVPGYLVGIPAEPVFQNEEHMVCRMRQGLESLRPVIGTVLYIIPAHICTTTILYPRVPVIHDGHLIGSWSVTARDRLTQF